VAVDGTHATGKTTLVYASTSRFRELGINAGLVGDTARESPLVDDIVLHKTGEFDALVELDLASRHVQAIATAVRTHALVFADKTLLNVATYANVLLGSTLSKQDRHLIDALNSLASAWQRIYDLVIYCPDLFPVHVAGDPYRARVEHLQLEVDEALKEAYARGGFPVVTLPEGLSLAQRVAVVESLAKERCLVQCEIHTDQGAE
jgi:predicted ATPase